MITSPASATRALLMRARSAPSIFHWEKSTRLTRVAGFDMTIPAFFRPMTVINKPIQGVMAVFTAEGMDLIIASRSTIAVITMKNTPEMNTTSRG